MKTTDLDNVTKVSVDSRLDNPNEIPDDDVDEETYDEEAIKGFVNKATLTGSSVLSSETYQELNKNNFYIYKLGWQMIEKKSDGNKLESEAYFSDAPEYKKFSCLATGM
jgi:hypothetical protein